MKYFRARTWRPSYGDHQIIINEKLETKIRVRPNKVSKVVIELSSGRKAQGTPPTPKPEPVSKSEPEMVVLHVFERAAQMWKPKYHGRGLKFRKMAFPVTASINDVFDELPSNIGEGFAITEVHEIGGGTWTKGTTIPYASDKSSNTLKDLGWTSMRGAKKPPVYIAIHKMAK